MRDQLDALMSKHAHSFPRWKSEMDWGWSPLFYGVGSKREVRGASRGSKSNTCLSSLVRASAPRREAYL